MTLQGIDFHKNWSYHIFAISLSLAHVDLRITGCDRTLSTLIFKLACFLSSRAPAPKYWCSPHDDPIHCIHKQGKSPHSAAKALI